MTDANIVDKIRKLLRLAESSNEHEASAAMAKAQELMLAHAIEEQHLRTDDDRGRGASIEHRYFDVPSRSTGVKARRWLLQMVVSSNRCKLVKYGPQSGTKYCITGFTTDMDFVVNLYESLLRQMTAAVEADRGATSTTAKNNFMWGYTERVTTRLAAKMARTMTQLAETTDFLPALRERQAEVDVAYAQRYPKLTQMAFGKPGAYDATARERGRLAGEKASLAEARAALR